MEVMGLMMGEFVDDYTIRVVDVFAMPQSGTGVSVEAVDPVFQTNMVEMLKQTNRGELVVGWYHSHPGFGCWLSGVDVNTQQSFEQLNKRSVAVVVDPIQSVRGKVVMDAFRTIDQQSMMLGLPSRQTTSNVGQLRKPALQALMHNLNRQYYSINIDSRKSSLEHAMLLALRKHGWARGLGTVDWAEHAEGNEKALERMLGHVKEYQKRIDEEDGKTPLEVIVGSAGKLDPKKHLDAAVEEAFANNISQSLGAMLATVVF